MRGIPDIYSALNRLTTGSPPTVEDIENGRKPADFYKVQAAVLEIRLRLLLERDEDPRRAISSKDLQSAIASAYGMPGAAPKDEAEISSGDIERLSQKYDLWTKSYMSDRVLPDDIFPLVGKLVEEGVFKDKLSKRLAERIRDGIAYFAPHLLVAPATRPTRQDVYAPALDAALS